MGFSYVARMTAFVVLITTQPPVSESFQQAAHGQCTRVRQNKQAINSQSFVPWGWHSLDLPYRLLPGSVTDTKRSKQSSKQTQTGAWVCEAQQRSHAHTHTLTLTYTLSLAHTHTHLLKLTYKHTLTNTHTPLRRK